jgi:membrane fusion protein, multidrug efflux system
MSIRERLTPALVGRVLFGAVLLFTLILAYRLAIDLDRTPSTTDAEIDAEVVPVSSAVAGRLLELAVRENASVKAGQLLFRIDPTTYRLELEAAEAAVAVAEGGLADQERLRESERANAVVAHDQVERARANLDLANRTVERLQPMVAAGYVSRQSLDEARTAAGDAQVSLRQAEGAARAADAAVQTTRALEAQVRASRAQAGVARRALEQTEVRAPVDGKVVGLTIAAGAFVVPGQTLFTLIDTATWAAEGLFRETDLAGIAVGDPAEVYVMTDRRVPIMGEVESIGWGIASDDAVALAGKMPFVARSLNWVRVAARFPVRIRLHNPPERLMRKGASAIVVLHEQRGEH